MALFSVSLGSRPLDHRQAIQAINQSLPSGQKLYLWSARKPEAEAKPGHWDARALPADSRAEVKSQLPIVGQGG